MFVETVWSDKKTRVKSNKFRYCRIADVKEMLALNVDDFNYLRFFGKYKNMFYYFAAEMDFFNDDVLSLNLFIYGTFYNSLKGHGR